MTTEPPRQSPQSAIQATGQVASDIVGGLKTQPALLAIVVLNVVMLFTLFWFQSSVNEAVKSNRDQLLQMVSECLHQQQGKFVPGKGLGRDGKV